MPPRAPDLLDPDGTASMATAFMMAHHGLRRDLAQFANALGRVAAGDASRIAALREEWQSYRGTLHGHHQVEDERIFPQMRIDHSDLAPIVDGLAADHRRIDPILEQGDRAFADLPGTVKEATAVVSELRSLLDTHLATEEMHVVPLLRAAKEFPPPQNEAEMELYAQGFAWSSHGVAPDVLDRVYEMLPRALCDKLPAARDAFERRCERVWGSAETGASRTPIPDWLEVR